MCVCVFVSMHVPLHLLLSTETKSGFRCVSWFIQSTGVLAGACVCVCVCMQQSANQNVGRSGNIDWTDHWLDRRSCAVVWVDTWWQRWVRLMKKYIKPYCIDVIHDSPPPCRQPDKLVVVWTRRSRRKSSKVCILKTKKRNNKTSKDVSTESNFMLFLSLSQQAHSWQPGIKNPYRGVVVWPVPENIEITVTLFKVGYSCYESSLIDFFLFRLC